MSANIKDKRINIKVTSAERKEWQSMAKAKNMTVADLIRDALGREKVGIAPKRRASRKADPVLIANLARIGNNLNQIARWANTYKSDAEAVEVVAGLMSIEKNLFFLLPQAPKGAAAQAAHSKETNNDAG